MSREIFHPPIARNVPNSPKNPLDKATEPLHIILKQMTVKAVFGSEFCPACGGDMIYHDYESTELYTAICKECGKEWELRKNPGQKNFEIKPKKIN